MELKVGGSCEAMGVHHLEIGSAARQTMEKAAPEVVLVLGGPLALELGDLEVVAGTHGTGETGVAQAVPVH